MLKFLSKFRYSLLGGSPVQKYFLYAVGEIFLVVIGILLALQINNWNEKKKERREEKEILEGFNRDLVSDLDQLNLNIHSTGKKMANIDSLFVLLKNPASYALADLIRFNLEIPNVDYFLASSGTFDEAVSSGKMRYIENDTLREAIFDYYRFIKFSGTDGVTNKYVEEIVIPQWGELVIPYTETMAYLGFDTDLPSIDVRLLSKNRKYNQLVAQKYATNQAQIANWRRTIEHASKLKRIIELELERINQ